MSEDIYGPYGRDASAPDQPRSKMPATDQPRMRMRQVLARLGAQRNQPDAVLDPLIRTVHAHNPKADTSLIERAYRTAEHYHTGQLRKSGDAYITHPLAVATILAELGMSEATLCAALLHDTVEDTSYTVEQLQADFGAEIAAMVDGVTKLDKIQYGESAKAETIRKMVLAMSKDIRVLVIKLADRLHNMRTLDHMPEAKRLRIAEETMEIYAPLAGRMGMQGMREELEEIAFRYINPEAYRTVTERLAEIFERNRGVLDEIEKALSALFDKYRIKATVTSRQKKPWSVFRKMEAKALSFEQLSDIMAFRITVDDIGQCSQAILLNC